MEAAIFAFVPNSPWDRCISHFLDFCYDHSQSTETLRIYRYILMLFFSTPPVRLPDEYTREDVLSFIHQPSRTNRSKGQPPSISSMNLRLDVLRSFYGFAASFTIPGPDGKPHPILQVVPPTLGLHDGTPPKVYRSLSRDELKRLFAVIPDTLEGLRDYACFGMFFWTARRRSEIMRLLWGDIMPSSLVASGFVYRFTGKGNKVDVAELPRRAKQFLDRYIEASGRAMEPDSPLFILTDKEANHYYRTDVSISPETMLRHLKQYAKLAGIDPRRVTLHSFRHSSARMRLEVGEKPESIQRTLRHRSFTTTMNIYLWESIGLEDNGAALIEARIGRDT